MMGVSWGLKEHRSCVYLSEGMWMFDLRWSLLNSGKGGGGDNNLVWQWGQHRLVSTGCVKIWSVRWEIGRDIKDIPRNKMWVWQGGVSCRGTVQWFIDANA